MQFVSLGPPFRLISHVSDIAGENIPTSIISVMWNTLEKLTNISNISVFVFWPWLVRYNNND
jgi:hypothetical protein